MLLVVAALGLDACAARRGCAASRPAGVVREGLEHHQVDPRAGGLDARGPGSRRAPRTGRGPASMPPFSRRAAPASRCSWRQRNRSSWVLRASRSASSSRPGSSESASLRSAVRSVSTPERLAGHELRHAERVELAERVLVVGQQVLGRELQQDRVVALEGREDVGVGLQRGEAARAQVARAAAGLAAALDRVASRARWRPPSRPRRASRARAASGRRRRSSVKTACSSSTSRCWAKDSA